MNKHVLFSFLFFVGLASQVILPMDLGGDSAEYYSESCVERGVSEVAPTMRGLNYEQLNSIFEPHTNIRLEESRSAEIPGTADGHQKLDLPRSFSQDSHKYFERMWDAVSQQNFSRRDDSLELSPQDDGVSQIENARVLKDSSCCSKRTCGCCGGFMRKIFGCCRK